MAIGEGIGGNLAGAIEGMHRARAGAAAASAELEAARRRYWDAVASGRDVAAARAEFAARLAAKDFVYLLLAVPEGVQTGDFFSKIAGEVDGGIRPVARDAFEAWVRKIRQELGVATTPHNIDQLVLASPDRLAKALAAASQQEAAYRRARDWAELDASGLTFPWDNDARLYVLMILQRYSAVRPAEQILENYRELIDLFGEKPVLAAAERVRAVPRGADGLLVRAPAPGVGSRSPDAAFTEILATQSGGAYFKYLLWQGAGGLSRSPADARSEYDRFVWSYGASAVDAVATTVLDLPKDQFGNISPDTISKLQVPPGKHAAIWTLLERRDPQGRVRAMFAFHPEAKSSGDIERLRRALVERYGEQRVIEATRSLHEFWHGAAAGSRTMVERRTRVWEEGRQALNLPRGVDLHLYERDYDLIGRILEEGGTAGLGAAAPAPGVKTLDRASLDAAVASLADNQYVAALGGEQFSGTAYFSVGRAVHWSQPGGALSFYFCSSASSSPPEFEGTLSSGIGPRDASRAHEPSSLMGRVRGDLFGWNRNGPLPGHLTLTATSDSLMAGTLKATVIMSDRSERPFEVHFRAERGTGCGGR